MSTKKADRKLPASKTSQSNSGMRNLYRRSNASFVFAATPRPQNTLRTNFYSVMLSFDRFYFKSEKHSALLASNRDSTDCKSCKRALALQIFGQINLSPKF